MQNYLKHPSNTKKKKTLGFNYSGWRIEYNVDSWDGCEAVGLRNPENKIKDSDSQSEQKYP